VSTFVSAVERQMLDLVRGNPRRLALLMVATVAAYACMALEAWVILRASGTPVSGIGALAIETFSRVASFASAFIPANLGALEASSLAAVAAVGVAGGGAALALARRLRGLFWAGVGLAIYPRRIHPEPDGPYRGRTGVVPGSRANVVAHAEMWCLTRDPAFPASVPHVRATPARPRCGPGTAPVLLFLPEDAGVNVSAGVRLAGLAIGERIVRAALRAGYTRVFVWQPEAAANARLFDALARQLEGVAVLRSVEAWREAIATLDPALAVTVVGAGTVVSPALLADAAALDMGEDAVRDVPAGADWPVTGVIRVRAGDAMRPATLSALLSTRYANDARPSGEDVSYGRARLAIRMVEPHDVHSAERTLRRSIFKDTDGRIAQFNRRISLPISIALIRTPLTANQLSILLVAVGFYSGWLFSLGHYWTGMLAACLSLVASILDGSDGEIARLKYQESALGCWIETVGDYSYYIAVFIGLTFGVVRQTGHPAYYWIGLIALGGTLLTFALLIYLRARITGGQPTRMHAVAKTRFHADPSLWSRLILKLAVLCTRAAMPYGILVLAVLNALPVALLLAALGGNLYWISLVAKLRDLLRDETEMMAAQ
jgi:phosphatidylglycerophosphate synthase